MKPFKKISINEVGQYIATNKIIGNNHKQFWILLVFFIQSFLISQTNNSSTLISQTNYYIQPSHCATPLYNSIPQTNALGCPAVSNAFVNKYGKQSFYVPNSIPSASPLKTIKIAFHVFNKSDGSGSYPTSYDSILGGYIKNTVEYWGRFSEPYKGSNLQTPIYIYDSRTAYEVVGVYHYNNTTLNLYNGTSNSHFVAWDNAINTADPSRLENAIPIYFTNGSLSGALGHANFPNGTGFASPGHPYVVSFVDPGQADYFVGMHLRHELGHVFGFSHAYNDPADMTCSNADFLSDVYPTPNIYWQQTGCGNPNFQLPCGTAFETQPATTGPWPYTSLDNNNGTNSLMSACVDNIWISPLQMGRRRRTMSLPTITNVRKYAKDLESDHVNVWNIDSNETWDFDIQMYNDIVVKAGNTLSVTCKIAMPINGKIIVEKGAKLVIDGGEITGWCKTGMWKGIELDGNSSLNQAYSGGYAIHQGMAVLINGATISKAQDGITTGVYDLNGNFVWGSQGGVIAAWDANFLNNVHDIEFLAYGIQNKSTFNKCNFKITQALEANALPEDRVTLWEVSGVRFLGCNFEFAAQSIYPAGTRGDAIYSIDASYFVDRYCSSITNTCPTFTKTQIKEFDNGVRVDNTNPLRVVSIKNTNFYDNITNAVYYNSINTPVFESNYVRTPRIWGGSCGLYLNNSKYYSVKSNTFVEAPAGPNSLPSDVGIFVHNSQNGSHQIYKNSFSNLMVGIDPIGNNSGGANVIDGLKMNCNDFAQQQNLYDIAMTGFVPTVMKTQGAITAQTSTNVVRNIYAANCGNENKWYIDATSFKTVFHGSNSNANAQPLPQSSCSNLFVNVVNSGIPMNYALDCNINSSNSSDPNYLSNLNSVIGNAQLANNSLIGNYNALIDGGNTQNLLNSINGGTSNGNLKNLLASKSPYLSDEVLSSYFEKPNVPPGHVKEIHNLNKPVSSDVWQIIVSKNLPNGIMNQIISQQNSQLISERDKLQSQVSLSNFDLQTLCIEKLNYFLLDSLESSKDSVISTLIRNAGKMADSEVQLAFAYANKKDYEKAIEKANQIVDVSEWSTLPSKLIEYYQKPEGIMYLKYDLSDKDYFVNFANRGELAGTSSAQSFLKFNLNQSYFIPRYLPQQGGTGAKAANASNQLLQENNNFMLFPNPAKDAVNFVLKDLDKDELNIQIMDALGRILFKKDINQQSRVEIPLDNFTGGVYIFNIYSGKESLFSKKLVISK